MAKRTILDSDREFFIKPLSGGNRALVAINRSSEQPRDFSISWESLAFENNSTEGYLRDLWKHQDLGLISSSIEFTVEPHDVAMLLVSLEPVDTNRPTIERVSALDITTAELLIQFSKPIHPHELKNATYFSLNNGITVESARPGEDPSIVILTTSPLQNHEQYTLTVNNIRDNTFIKNEINANTTYSFSLQTSPVTKNRNYCSSVQNSKSYFEINGRIASFDKLGAANTVFFENTPLKMKKIIPKVVIR